MCLKDGPANTAKSVRKTGWLLQIPPPSSFFNTKGHIGASGAALTAVGQAWPLLCAMSPAVEWCGHSGHTRPQQRVQHTCQPEERSWGPCGQDKDGWSWQHGISTKGTLTLPSEEPERAMSMQKSALLIWTTFKQLHGHDGQQARSFLRWERSAWSCLGGATRNTRRRRRWGAAGGHRIGEIQT